MPASTLSWDSAWERWLCGKDKGTGWHPIPSRKGGAHGAIPVADQDPRAPLGLVSSSQQDTAGQAGPGRAPGQGPPMADTTQARARAAPLWLAWYLNCRWAPAEFIPRQLKASDFSLPKTRKKTKYEKRIQKGRSLCLSKDQAASKAKTTQKKGTSCLLEQTSIMPTIASHPSHFSSCRVLKSQ